MLKHYLFSQNEEKYINVYQEFNREAIKEAIVTHLTANPTDCIEHQKESDKKTLKRVVGNMIVNYYEVNPKTKEISRVILKGDKTYYVKLIK